MLETKELVKIYKPKKGVPVTALNKIDLPSAEPEKVKQQIEDVIGLDASDAVEVSGKTGFGIDNLLEEIVHKLPAPTGDEKAPLFMLVFFWNLR